MMNYLHNPVSNRIRPPLLVESQSGALQIGGANAWHVLETANEIELNQGGYLAVYISNASMDIITHFDNIHINYYRGKLQEENHYYPYGLCLRLSQATGITPNNYLYQTKELTGMVGNDALNLYDFGARQYDPILGRFTGLDPMGQFASGYVGMGNNPTSLTDPTGMYVSDHIEQSFTIQALGMQNKQIAEGLEFDRSNSGGALELEASVAGIDYAMTTSDKYFNAAEYWAEQDNLNKLEKYTNVLRAEMKEHFPLLSFENWSMHSLEELKEYVDSDQPEIIGADGGQIEGEKIIEINGKEYQIGDNLDPSKGGFLGMSEEEAVRYIVAYSEATNHELAYAELNVSGVNYYYICSTTWEENGATTKNSSHSANRHVPEELRDYVTYTNHSHNTRGGYVGTSSVDQENTNATNKPYYFTEVRGERIEIFQTMKCYRQSGVVMIPSGVPIENGISVGRITFYYRIFYEVGFPYQRRYTLSEFINRR